MCCNTFWLAVWFYSNVVRVSDDLQLAGDAFNGLQILSDVLILMLRSYGLKHSYKWVNKIEKWAFLNSRRVCHLREWTWNETKVLE